MNNLQLPGPFVVFQGIPGDGLCNTMLQEDDDEYFDWQEDEEEEKQDDDGGEDDDDSLYACQDDNNDENMEEESNINPHPHPSSTQAAQSQAAATIIHRHNNILRSPATTTTATNTITTTNTTAPSATRTTTTFLGQGFMNPAFSATTSTTPAVGGGTLRRRPTSATASASITATSAQSAVRPTILPPIISTDDRDTATTTTSTTASFFDMEASLVATAARIAAAVASSSSPSPTSQRPSFSTTAPTTATTRTITNSADIDRDDDEDFVVVNDSSNNTRSTTAAAAQQQQQSTSTANNTATASSISPKKPLRQESSQQQQQQLDTTSNEVQRAKTKMIQLWKTASRTRVAHLHREWFSNCKATAPNLTTMEIQPWLISSTSIPQHQHGGGDDNDDDDTSNSHHYELAVFDRLPTNTRLLQNYNNKTSSNSTARHDHHPDVVLPTAKIVGSLAPGMTVIGTAITTFEIIIPNHNNHYYARNNSSNIDCSQPQQSQAPACLVANALDSAVTAASSSRLEFCQHETFGPNGTTSATVSGGPVLVPQQGRLQFLHLQSSPSHDDEGNNSRVVLYSIHGYTVLGAGLPSVYAQPDVWYWKVTCPVGAYVREGLDLTTHLKEVLPYGTVCQVQRKTVNAHGLARLSIRAILPLDDDDDNQDAQDDDAAADATDNSFYNHNSALASVAAGAATASTNSTATTSSSSSPSSLLSRQNSRTSNSSSGERRQQRARNRRQQQQRPSPCRLVEGWCSQFLNPMSGQGGSVVQPIPFCVPVVYRITLPEGAVVRQEIELTSPQIGHIPCGAVVTVTERAFSEFPTDKCIERLRLAPGTSFCNGAGAGWISVRLNKKSPEDRLVVQYVGLDINFDPKQAGIFHYQQASAAAALATSITEQLQQHQQQQSGLLDYARLRQGSSSQHQFNHNQNQYSTTPTIHEISSIDENESRSSLSSSGGGGGGGGFGSGTLPMTTTTTSAATAAIRDPQHQQHPPLSTKKNNDHRRRRRRPDTPDNSCLCCIDKTRNATMVHGDTGHIACCLDCARMLKASGQPCPVCRLPIDLVILHYWA